MIKIASNISNLHRNILGNAAKTAAKTAALNPDGFRQPKCKFLTKNSMKHLMKQENSEKLAWAPDLIINNR